MIPSLILLTASLTVADNGPSPYSNVDLGRTEVEKQWLVGQIVVVGNTRTRQSIIDKRLPFCPPCRITARQLQIAEDNLARTKLFKKFSLNLCVLGEDSDNPFRIMLVVVEEREPTYPWDRAMSDMEDDFIDAAVVGLSLVLPPQPAVSVCAWLEDWPVFKVRSGYEPMLHETEAVLFLAIAVPRSQLFELQKSVGQAVRSCCPKAGEEKLANLYSGNRLPAALRLARR